MCLAGNKKNMIWFIVGSEEDYYDSFRTWNVLGFTSHIAAIHHLSKLRKVVNSELRGEQFLDAIHQLDKDYYTILG